MAIVGLEQTYFNVIESVGEVELCAQVIHPPINCPVQFPFDIGLSTSDRTAGTAIIASQHKQFYVNHCLSKVIICPQYKLLILNLLKYC